MGFARPKPTVSQITVSGFKSIDTRQSIAIKPLTILAGANSSGKSSILQPVLLMKQTMESLLETDPLFLGGPHVSVRRVADLLAERMERVPSSLRLSSP